MPPEKLVFLDESGCSTGMVRTHGWSPCGKRAWSYRPMAGWKHLTMVGAVRLGKMVTLCKHRGGTTGKKFLAFVRFHLAPKLKPGDVVVLDNLASHKVKGVREAVEAVGATLKYLPPYSPDLNPIEPVWSKMKGLLRKAGAATERLLRAAIGLAARRITSGDIAGWFRHCGYLQPERSPL